MGVYEPITQFLRGAGERRVRLTFQDVEGIINRPLPRSAYRHREWWANNPTGHSHARSWVDAGWRTENVDLEKRVLVFSKQGGAPSTPSAPQAEQIPDPFGAMRGSVTFFADVDLTAPTGEEWAAERDGSE
jgi:hypothetical protein